MKLKLALGLLVGCMFAGCMLGDGSYPPCSFIQGEPNSPPPAPGPEPGPYLPPTPGDNNFADDPKKYSVSEDGEVCECAQEQLGCVDSPDKAKKSAQPGAYCPYPRGQADEILLGLVSLSNKNMGDTCTCTFTTEECGTIQSHIFTDIPGRDIMECTEFLRKVLSQHLQSFSPQIQSCKPN